MAMSPKLEMRAGQQLVMTPQLQQAIRLLQFSNMELSAFVDAELERNPMLEREEGELDVPPPAPESTAAERAAGDADAPEEWLELKAPSTDTAEAYDTEFENVFPDATRAEVAAEPSLGDWSSVRQTGASTFDSDDSNLEAFVSAEWSLKDHLTQQMLLAITHPAERLVAQHIVDLVDDAGYIQGDLEQLALRLGAPPAMAARVLAVLQSFDPPGVCARTLAECLALQLKDRNRYDPQIARLLENLPLLAAHSLTALRRAVDVDNDELAEMIGEIKALDPKPGLRFGRVHVQPVVPDVVVRPANSGSWLVELNTDTLPRVLVNRSYYATVSRTTRKDSDKGYLVECLANANWLVKSLDQRARTILRVAEEIVRQQDGFLTHGVQYLRPMNLKTVAEKISMHESTVSRVTSNKYMATPRGIFELKYFFTSAIAAADGEGESYSSESVRHRIRVLIDAEPPAQVLSDDKIVDKLKTDGIEIARRTVAKYREAMRIPSSVQRRREKTMSARLSRTG